MLNQTPFYGESGGQVGDTGDDDGATACASRVTDTQKKAGDLFVHDGKVEQGTLKVGDRARSSRSITRAARAIRANHSATHLLHEALRQVLGDHVAQKGSLVAPDRLRFDFSHPKPMTRGGDRAGRGHRQRLSCCRTRRSTTRLMALDDARASGARALFGEKYGDEVRVVAMGDEPAAATRMGWSVELCGGTHVRRTGDIGLISARRRLRRRRRRAPHRGADRRGGAQVGRTSRSQLAKAAAAELKVPLEELPARVAALLDERKQARARAHRREEEARHGRRRGAAGEDGVRSVGGIKLLARAVTGIEMKDLKSLADEGKKQLGSGVVAIVGVTEDGKAGIVVGVTDDLTARFNAVDLVRKAPRRSAARAAAGGPTWRRPAGRTARRPRRRSRPIAAALGPG